MIIYLEGPDGSGKTTLCKKIQEMCNTLGINWALGEVLINTNPIKPDRCTNQQLFERMFRMLYSDDVCYILDRGPISDCVYRLFDNYEPVVEFPELYSFFEMHAAKIHFIYCHNSQAEKFMKERGDDNPVALAKHHKISQAYDIAMLCIRDLHATVYDFTNENNRQYVERRIRNTLAGWFNK